MTRLAFRKGVGLKSRGADRPPNRAADRPPDPPTHQPSVCCALSRFASNDLCHIPPVRAQGMWVPAQNLSAMLCALSGPLTLRTTHCRPCSDEVLAVGVNHVGRNGTHAVAKHHAVLCELLLQPGVHQRRGLPNTHSAPAHTQSGSGTHSAAAQNANRCSGAASNTRFKDIHRPWFRRLVCSSSSTTPRPKPGAEQATRHPGPARRRVRARSGRVHRARCPSVTCCWPARLPSTCCGGVIVDSMLVPLPVP